MNPFTQKPSLGRLPRNGHWSTIDRPLALDMMDKGDLHNYGTDKLTITNNGATPINGPDGGGALSFDGTAGSQLVDCGTSDSLWLNGNPVTIACVATANSAGAGNVGHIVQRATGNVGEISISPSQRIQFRVNGSTDLIKISASNSMPFGVRKHITVTWDGSNSASNVHIYFNGIETSSYVASIDGVGIIDNSGANFVIGNRTIGGRQWDGVIEYVDVYCCTLTAQQINSLYNDPWQAYRRDNTALWAAAQGGVIGSVNLLDGLFERKRLIA